MRQARCGNRINPLMGGGNDALDAAEGGGGGVGQEGIGAIAAAPQTCIRIAVESCRSIPNQALRSHHDAATSERRSGQSVDVSAGSKIKCDGDRDVRWYIYRSRYGDMATTIGLQAYGSACANLKRIGCGRTVLS